MSNTIETKSWTSGNSQYTYTVPSSANRINVTVRGSQGSNGDWGYGEDCSASKGSGGAGGEISASYDVSPGETFTINVAGGQNSPHNGGVSGGDGGSNREGGFGTYYSGDGGRGGAPSSIKHDSENIYICIGEGGGGGGGAGAQYWGGKNYVRLIGGGGGGAALGGSGGSGGYNGNGGNGDGTGNGGDGGNGGDKCGDGGDGTAGGTQSHTDVFNVSTTTSTNSPKVEIEAVQVVNPPSQPTNVSVSQI